MMSPFTSLRSKFVVREYVSTITSAVRRNLTFYSPGERSRSAWRRTSTAEHKTGLNRPKPRLTRVRFRTRVAYLRPSGMAEGLVIPHLPAGCRAPGCHSLGMTWLLGCARNDEL